VDRCDLEPGDRCTKISPGCDHCYAERSALRLQRIGLEAYRNGFDVTLHVDLLNRPLGWKKPQMVFVNSMSDLFHRDIPENFIGRAFDIMEQADWHIYQVLTKRSPLMQRFINHRYSSEPCPAHIWLGVSVKNAAAKSRIPHLQKTHATMRFLSIEPLLAPVGELNLEGIHWVIVGGESGPQARPMDVEWARSVREQCVSAGVPFFMKQMGGVRDKRG
jgi:protein gp37